MEWFGGLKMPSARPPRRCTECGTSQHLIHATTDYPESGLDNVRLVDAPIWERSSGHRDVEIRNPEQLHGLLADLLIRKPTALTGSEIRFCEESTR